MLGRRILVVGGLSFAAACDFMPCENRPIGEVPSPDGSFSAWVFERNCGATTGFSTQVSVLAQGEGPPSEGGNALVLGDRVGVVASWRGRDQLSISFEGTGQVFLQESQVAGIEITYEPE
jgi:hypothetical protein